jgi:hypothetical protein
MMLFSPAGARVGLTADLSASFGTPGRLVAPLAGGPYAAAAGMYHVGIYVNGTTRPIFAQRYCTLGSTTAAGSLNQGMTGASQRLGSSTGTYTNNPPATLPALNDFAYAAPWMAMS